ncbi:hypothetical protein KI387_031591, partial [Taxus chinensis]
MEEVRILRERIQEVELSKRRDIEYEEESEEEHPGELTVDIPPLEASKDILIKDITGTNFKPKMEVPLYEGSLKPEDLIDWINVMDKYFEYEKVENDKKVKFVVTRLKSHASL